MVTNFPTSPLRRAAAGALSNGWWNDVRFTILALLLSAVPLLWPAIPPLIDLPSHMGAYHIGASIDTSQTLRRFYDFHWQVLGNLGVELLAIPLAKFVGVELATKLIVLAIPLLTVVGMLWIAREIHGELPPTIGFALPLAYCYPLQFGFVNYCLSMALMLLGLGLWLRLGRAGRPRLRALVFALLAPLVWISHAIGWALLLAACGCAELARQDQAGTSWRRRLARTAVTCLPLCTPLLIMLALPPGKPGAARGWLLLPELAKWLVTLFRDRWITLDLASAGVFFGVLAIAATRRGGMHFRRTLALPALGLLAVFVLAPQSINDSGFVNGRIAPYALMLLMLAIGTRDATARQRRTLAIAATAFLVVRTAATTASMALYSLSWDANLRALDHIAPGSRVVAFSPVPCAHGLGNWWGPRVYHLPGMAIVRKDAFVNTEWQIDGLQILRTRYAAARPFDADPSQTVTLDCGVPGFRQYKDALANFPRAAFDTLWLLEVPRDHWPDDPGLTLVWSWHDSALYRIAH